jgi:hypothetical protein
VLYQLSYSREQTTVLVVTASHGGEGNRTPDLLNAIQALSQLSYTPGIPERASPSDRNREGYPRVVSMSRKSPWLNQRRPVSCSASIPEFFDHAKTPLVARFSGCEDNTIRSHCWPVKKAAFALAFTEVPRGVHQWLK